MRLAWTDTDYTDVVMILEEIETGRGCFQPKTVACRSLACRLGAHEKKSFLLEARPFEGKFNGTCPWVYLD